MQIVLSPDGKYLICQTKLAKLPLRVHRIALPTKCIPKDPKNLSKADHRKLSFLITLFSNWLADTIDIEDKAVPVFYYENKVYVVALQRELF